MYVIIYVITTYSYIIQSNTYVCIRMHVYITKSFHMHYFSRLKGQKGLGTFLWVTLVRLRRTTLGHPTFSSLLNRKNCQRNSYYVKNVILLLLVDIRILNNIDIHLLPWCLWTASSTLTPQILLNLYSNNSSNHLLSSPTITPAMSISHLDDFNSLGPGLLASR